MAGTVLGVDAGSPTAADAEHRLRRLADELGVDPGTVLCTHPVRSGTPHYAGTLSWSGPPPVAGLALRPAAGGAGPALTAAGPAVPEAGLALLPAGPDGAPAVPGAGLALLPAVAGAAAASGEVGGDPVLAASALAAARERAAGTAGRAVRFPGMELLTGTVPVADVLARTAIEEVRVLGGALPAAARLVTRDFVRPEWSGGRLVLLVLPGGPGLVAPFEVPNPTPCCAAHH